jgi:hypothetical protein
MVMATRILWNRARAPLAKGLLRHPVKGTRALARARRVEKILKSPAGALAVGALVAIPIGLVALKRVRAR